MNKKIIVISAVNFTSGGPLSILNDVLSFANKYLVNDYRIIALVHKCSIFDSELGDIEFVEFPESVSSYKNRIFLEYFKFKKFSQQVKPYLWLSLHDMTPNVDATVRAVYCHNPAPFYKPNFSEIALDKSFFLFTLLYKWIYKVNIKKNDFVIVQQQWLRNQFIKIFNLQPNKVVVAYPQVENSAFDSQENRIIIKSPKFKFFYPSFPRVFKNFETVLAAVEILNSKVYLPEFEVLLTIDGSENRYSASLLKKYQKLQNVKFLGLLSRNDVYKNLINSNCLIFASKLETWGLPLTEAKQFSLPIIVADLPYAHETVGAYEYVSFFDPMSAYELAEVMEKAIVQHSCGSSSKAITPEQPFAENWASLFDILLNR